MTNSSKKILVPIGFTDQSIIALQQAVRIAKITNSNLYLISVVELPSAIKKLFIDYESEVDKLKIKLRNRLNDLREKYCSEINNVETVVSSGKIYTEIVNCAKMIDAYLIVMGTDGSNKNSSNKLIGSNANKVIRTAPCGVVTIKGKEFREGCKTIVLPLDLQKETKEKVKIAIEFSKLWNSEIKVVSVLKDTDEFVRNKLERNLNQVKKFISDQNIVCTSELIISDSSSRFFQTIVEYSKSVNADLIIIMTQQEDEFTLNFLGSNANYIIKHSDIPVMSVRPVDKKDTSTFGLR